MYLFRGGIRLVRREAETGVAFSPSCNLFTPWLPSVKFLLVLSLNYCAGVSTMFLKAIFP